jgi:phosphatidylserine/phosphatidylglycerophosphate/cardiolipin synthase-like enzyme
MKPVRMLRWRRESRSLPVTRGNSLSLLCGGKEYFSALLRAISGARREVLVENYVWAEDEVGLQVLEAAAGAARRGVEVRILLDGFGGYSVRQAAQRILAGTGAKLAVFNPVRFRPGFRRWYERNHRKIAVVDGTTAFIGGFGFRRDWTDLSPAGRWDLGARVEGPVAAQFRRAFAHDWYRSRRRDAFPPVEPVQGEKGREALRLLPSVLGRRDLLRSLRRSIKGARERAYVCTTYFIPGLRMRHALRRAARRGVDVRLLLPSPREESVAFIFAGRRHYHSLMSAGVRIFEYERAFIHSKYAVVDRKWGFVGSSNLDNWSGRFNLEADLETLSPESLEALEGRFLMDLEDSREISFERWKNRPFWMKLMERVFGWIDPVL